MAKRYSSVLGRSFEFLGQKNPALQIQELVARNQQRVLDEFMIIRDITYIGQIHAQSIGM